MSYALRDYQIKARKEIFSAIRLGIKRILCIAPTGAGKTLIACKGVIEPAVAKGKRVYFVAPRRQLINQTSGKLRELGVHHGIVMGSSCHTDYTKTVQVCSIQTLAKRWDKLPPPDVIIIDEAHNATDSNQFGKLVDRFPEAIVIGFTATPTRLDGLGLGRIFEHQIEVISIGDLIEQGYLIRPDWRVGPKPDLTGVKSTGGDYNQKELSERCSKAQLVGDLVSTWQEQGDFRPTVCFAASVAHSKHIVEAFTRSGIPAGHIEAKTPDEERQRQISALEQGKIKVLSSVGVFTEGFDCPAVGCVILARPTQSIARYIQMAGRGLRIYPGLDDCIFLDHAGLYWEHGSIEWPQKYDLKDRARQDRSDQFKERLCRHCKTLLDGYPLECPVCGKSLAARENIELRDMPETMDGRLKSVAEQEADAKELERERKYYQRLCEECMKNGKETWWIINQFRNRFGKKPSRAVKLGADPRPVFNPWKKTWKMEYRADTEARREKKKAKQQAEAIQPDLLPEERRDWTFSR